MEIHNAETGMADMTRESLTRDEFIELHQLYDRFSLAVERASATMHMKGMDSQAFRFEDQKCVALWDHIRELMTKAASTTH